MTSGRGSLAPCLAFSEAAPPSRDVWDTLLQPYEGRSVAPQMAFADLARGGALVLFSSVYHSKAVLAIHFLFC